MITSPAILQWWAREGYPGSSLLVQYGELFELLRQEPGNEALEGELARQEDFTMASLTQLEAS